MLYIFIILYNFVYIYSDKKKDIFEQTNSVKSNKSGI